MPYHFFFLDVFLPENHSFFDKTQLYNSMFLVSSAWHIITFPNYIATICMKTIVRQECIKYVGGVVRGRRVFPWYLNLLKVSDWLQDVFYCYISFLWCFCKLTVCYKLSHWTACNINQEVQRYIASWGTFILILDTWMKSFIANKVIF